MGDFSCFLRFLKFHLFFHIFQSIFIPIRWSLFYHVEQCMVTMYIFRLRRARWKRNLGTPQTPARGLRPPAPPLAASEVEEELGDTPNPGRGTQSPCTPS